MDYSNKVESGLQLFARLTSRPSLSGLYPPIFQDGPLENDVIEISGDSNAGKAQLLIQLVLNAVLPKEIGGMAAGVVILRTDGHFDLIKFVNCVKMKIREYSDADQMKITDTCVENLFIFDIFDSLQLSTTIHGLDNFLALKPTVSLVILDTISSFYWCDRLKTTKMTKMDTYLKEILKHLQCVTKEYKSVLLYTKPEYFSSKTIEDTENCVVEPTTERVNYRISLRSGENQSFIANFANGDNSAQKTFKIINSTIIWDV